MDGFRERDVTQLSATAAVAQIAERRLTSRALVDALPARISLRDGDVRAWLALSETAREQAEECDAVPPRPHRSP